MADEIIKILKKISKKDKEKLLLILQKIRNSDLENLDIKKIKGEKNQFRVRSGKYRILFIQENNKICIKWIRKRDENTY